MIAEQSIEKRLLENNANNDKVGLMSLVMFENSRLVLEAGNAWREGTTGKFLTAIRDGTLPQDSFERWLLQDYLFVQGLTKFLAIALSKTPRPAQKALVRGVVALDAELDWFEQHLSLRQLNLRAAPHTTCQRYVDFLIQRSYSERFEVLLAVIFGVEVCYLYAWSSLEPVGPYAEFIARWSTPQFASYVSELLDLCDAYPHVDQQRAFNEVMRHEKDFWQMSWGD